MTLFQTEFDERLNAWDRRMETLQGVIRDAIERTENEIDAAHMLVTKTEPGSRRQHFLVGAHCYNTSTTSPVLRLLCDVLENDAELAYEHYRTRELQRLVRRCTTVIPYQ